MNVKKKSKINKKTPVLFLIFVFLCLKIDSQTEMWGLSQMGGSSNVGVIFKTDGSGNNYNKEYEFLIIEGERPTYNELTEAVDGKLYGMTTSGGSNFTGVLFQYDQNTNSQSRMIDFTGLNGAIPKGSLLSASDGKLYGMTQTGGLNTSLDGNLFQYDPVSNIFVNKVNLNYSTDGGHPSGSLIQATNGVLYGMTEHGGIYGYGVLFQYDIATDLYTKLFDFEGLNDGGNPVGSLIQASNGKLYGMTSIGGLNNKGVLFEYDISSNVSSIKFDFDGATNGSYPTGSLIQATDGKLYGMTSQGGLNNLGVIFQFNPANGSFVKKFNFSSTTGSEPLGSLFQATDGRLYGMTQHGGLNNKGVLFQYIPVLNSYTKKVDFSGFTSGSNPQGSVMQASNGKLYGMTYDGGTDNLGVLFEYNFTSSTFIKKLDFGRAINGRYPSGTLLKSTDGKLYGTTLEGGINNCGVLFQYDPATQFYLKKIDFDSISNGQLPRSTLIQATDGMLYGITEKGGVNNLGIIFQYNPLLNTLTKKIDFDGSIKGSEPWAGLFQANDGMLYGTTSKGGINNKGVLFQYDFFMNTYNKKIDFDGLTNGSEPIGALIQAADMKLYGSTNGGGVNSKGTLFQYDLNTNTLVKKIDFDGISNGQYPVNNVIEAIDGNLYGTTGSGGINDYGVLFQYNTTTGNYSKKIDFDAVNNGFIPGKLLQALNGNLYGTTAIGGINNKGVMFQYDFVSNTFFKKIDFTGPDGAFLGSNYLMEMPYTVTSIREMIHSNELNIYPNPTNDLLFVYAISSIQKLDLINVTGQVLLSQSVDAKFCQIQLNSISEGIYFLRVLYENGSFEIKKIIRK
jgi:uncharacterized repeat protein (TIGR03803 family)